MSAAVRTFLGKFPFAHDASSVSIMDGADEGAFQWLTINYLLGNLGKEIRATVAAIDLGGGSVQLAHAVRTQTHFHAPKSSAKKGACPSPQPSHPPSPSSSLTPMYPPCPSVSAPQISDVRAAKAPAGYVRPLHGNGRVYDVYVHSYLGYGLMAGRAAVLALAGGKAQACVTAPGGINYSYRRARGGSAAFASRAAEHDEFPTAPGRGGYVCLHRAVLSAEPHFPSPLPCSAARPSAHAHPPAASPTW